MLAGVWLDLLPFVLIGTCITGAASWGFTYVASLAEVPRRVPHDRARATAGLFVYAHLGFSLPVIASGTLAETFGLLAAMEVFAIVQITTTLVVTIV